MEPQDFTDVLKLTEKSGATAVAGKNGKRFEKVSFSVQEALEGISSPMLKDQMIRTITMAVNSYDLSGIRLTSIADVQPELLNRTTVFHDIIDQNGVLPVTDFQVMWPELYAGDDAVEFFNLNGANPGEAEMDRGVMTNTMGALGNKLSIPWITEELAAQSPRRPFAERANQIRMQLGRMRRFANQKLLANTEVTAETAAFFPQWGGFATRSTANGLVLGVAGNLTNAIIQGRVDAIANNASNNGLGRTVPLVALCGGAQIAVIRDLMIARFPGENSQSYLATQSQMMATLPGVKLPSDMVRAYQPDPGRAVLFVEEPQLTSGQCILFDPSEPRLGQMSINSKFGPWVVERPVPELSTLLVIFDFKTLIDPLTASRSLISNLSA